MRQERKMREFIHYTTLSVTISAFLVGAMMVLVWIMGVISNHNLELFLRGD